MPGAAARAAADPIPPGRRDPSERHRRRRRERLITTPFYIAAYILAVLAPGCGWLRGGHPERFGALVLLLDAAVSKIGDHWNIREFAPVAAAQDFFVMLAFAWLALRTDRWWPIAATALMALCVLVRLMGMVTPELSRFAVMSAILGVWILLYTVVLAGVAERWLSGETAVGDGKLWRPRRAPRAGGRR